MFWLTVALAAGLYPVGRWLGGNLTLGMWRHIVVASTLILVAGYFAAYALHGNPWLAGYAPMLAESLLTARVWPASDLILAGIGLLAGYVHVVGGHHPQLKSLLGGSMVPILAVACLCSPQLKSWLQPLPKAVTPAIWDEGICIQSTNYTCGPASMATLFHQQGLSFDERTLATEVGCTQRGSEIWRVARVLQQHGLNAHLIALGPEARTIPVPAVALVRLGTFDHYVAILARQGERYVVGDPATGRVIGTKPDLMNRYGPLTLLVTLR